MAANSSAINVVRVDTTALIPGVIFVSAIKYVGATAASSVIFRNASASGMKVWEHTGSSPWSDHDMFITADNGLHATVAGSAIAYLYLSR